MLYHLLDLNSLFTVVSVSLMLFLRRQKLDQFSSPIKVDLNFFCFCQKTEAVCVCNSRKAQDRMERIQYF